MSDRLEEIRQDWQNMQNADEPIQILDDVAWLIAEVDRSRERYSTRSQMMADAIAETLSLRAEVESLREGSRPTAPEPSEVTQVFAKSLRAALGGSPHPSAGDPSEGRLARLEYVRRMGHGDERNCGHPDLVANPDCVECAYDLGKRSGHAEAGAYYTWDEVKAKLDAEFGPSRQPPNPNFVQLARELEALRTRHPLECVTADALESVVRAALRGGSHQPEETVKVRTARMHLDCAIELIESVDQRAMACDGPVTPTRLEMTDAEMCEVYESLMLARADLDSLRGSSPEEPGKPQ